MTRPLHIQNGIFMDKFMNHILISAYTNEKIKEYRKLLTSRRARRENGLFPLEGLRLCADAAASGFTVENLFLTEAAAEKGGERIELLLKNAHRIYTVSSAVAEKMADTVSPQGVFCTVRTEEERIFQVREGGRYVLLDRVQNPQNLGAIARTAEALGADGLFVFAGCDRYNPKALRASMGSLLRLPVFETEDIAETLRVLGETVLTFAAVPDAGAQSVTDVDFSRGAAAVIGNEGEGVSDEVLRAVQSRVTIPMRGNAESLNAAAAAIILMWEMTK